MKLGFSKRLFPLSGSVNRPFGFLVEFLLITIAIAVSAGIGFGAALRLNRPDQPGSTVLHTEQSFPPRQDWPVSNQP